MRSAAPSFSIPAVFPCCYSLLFLPFPNWTCATRAARNVRLFNVDWNYRQRITKTTNFFGHHPGIAFLRSPQGTYSIFKFGVLAASLLSVLTSSNFSRISARSSADRVLRKVPLRMEAIFCYLLEVFPPAAGAATPKLLFSFDLDPSLSFDDQSAIIRN